MRINNINIKNFRGFADRSFDLDPKMNVVLGNNATGKTTLLHAVQIALGAYLQSLSLLPKDQPQQFRRGFKKDDHVKIYSETSKSFFPIKDNPSIEVDTVFTEELFNKNNNEIQSSLTKVRWTKNGNTISRKNNGELMDVVERLEEERRNADATGRISILPLILTFGATRLQNNYNAAQKTKARASREENAYKCALDEHVDFKSAFDWIYSFDKNVVKEKEFEGTDEAFFNAIKKGIPAIKQIDINIKNSEFYAQIQTTEDSDPQWLEYDMMSDGYQSVINMVAEIAYRCIMLNGFLGTDAVEKTPGIVMIDEVDLYLHPLWQRHVLEDFQRAFPNIQFIVTTHSPFIVQSVKSKNIIKLDGEKGNSDPNIRNMEEVAVVEMNVPSMHTDNYNKMLEKADEFYNLIKQGNSTPEEKARIKQELVELEAKFSENPAYVALLKAEGEIK